LTNKRTYVIAEVGPNHNGSVEMALELIRRLAELDIDAVKFQLAEPEKVYSADAYKADYQKARDGDDSVIEMSRRLQLTRQDHELLYAACREGGLDYLCTAFDIGSLEFLDSQFDLRYFKNASGEIHSIDMLTYISSQNRPVLLSTGMATFEEISKSLEILDPDNTKDVTIMHCVSVYPAPLEMINLAVIPELARRFSRTVGYSDHATGNECCLGAVALGATVIEKHVTLDKNLPGPDHKASATVEEMAELVAEIRKLEIALGQPEKQFSETETAIRRMARKSIVAARNIPAGTIITREDLCYKRPGSGFGPLETDNLIGRSTRLEISHDHVILPEHLE